MHQQSSMFQHEITYSEEVRPILMSKLSYSICSFTVLNNYVHVHLNVFFFFFFFFFGGRGLQWSSEGCNSVLKVQAAQWKRKKDLAWILSCGYY